jgi:2-(1,2-epoxy-1,2-dihydrophenyl)acetyl-CoA isomerase
VRRHIGGLAERGAQHGWTRRRPDGVGGKRIGGVEVWTILGGGDAQPVHGAKGSDVISPDRGGSAVGGPVLLDLDQGVARIVLNRPDQANAIDSTLGHAFAAVVDRVAADPTLRAVLLTGKGRMFCGGGDITEMKANAGALAQLMNRWVTSLHAAVLKIAALPIPVVCALNGPFAGGGVGLALCGDIVIAAESAKLRGGYTAIGLTPDMGTSFFLTRRAGPARAKELLLLNRSLSARECLEWGLVNAVYSDELLATEATALARRLANGATASFGRIKRLVDGAGGRSLDDHLDAERDCMMLSARTQDAQEGIAAFIEKRAARFLGK